MENIDEDIKQIKSSLKELETERDDIQLLCIKSELELSIENLLSRLKTAERMNDVLVKKILISDIAHSICKEVKIEECEKHELYSCKQCIKEWARKKVEDE